jgi:hypothetical protein
MIALFKLLGPSVIRFGGDDVDHETWDPAAASGGGSPFPAKIGMADVDALSDFLDATGWKPSTGSISRAAPRRIRRLMLVAFIRVM